MSLVRIRAIAAGGDGVGTLEDGRVVFVPRTAPGDVVECRVAESRRRFARAVPLRVIEAGPGRTEPECPHYVADQCGGCQLQHLAYEAQLEAKRRIVGDALRRIGRLEADDPPIVPSPSRWRYRARVTLRASGGRIGYHREGEPGRIFDLADCRIARETLMALWSAVSRQRRLLPSDLTALGLREDGEGGMHLIVESPATRVWDAEPLARAVGDPAVSYWWRPEGGAARVLAGPSTAYPVLAFEQVQPALGDSIRQEAVEEAAVAQGGVVWDLYAGSGETARALAARGAEVWAVETDHTAVDWGRDRARGWDRGSAVRWEADAAERVVARLPVPDVAVANPPRTGLGREVAEALERRALEPRPFRVVYVSCDPATLARDLGRMPGLRLRAVRAFDLFPQTAHVETLSVLEAA
jgi:23S rRNA (uracil1939-C5)-methyltransferase